MTGCRIPPLATIFPISYSETAPYGAVSAILSTIRRPNAQSPTHTFVNLRALAVPMSYPGFIYGGFVDGSADRPPPQRQSISDSVLRGEIQTANSWLTRVSRIVPRRVPCESDHSSPPPGRDKPAGVSGPPIADS